MCLLLTRDHEVVSLDVNAKYDICIREDCTAPGLPQSGRNFAGPALCLHFRYNGRY